ncbi:MAG: SGNH/GDSL hydrolase family protein [Melioribacteraceae bacterium]
MKKYFIILISLLILGDLFPQDISFFSGTSREDVSSSSWGFAEEPSKLNLFQHSFPISNEVSRSGSSSLKLQWQSKVGGDWGIAIAPKGWVNFNLEYYDTLSFWMYNENILDKTSLPKISLEDDRYIKTRYLNLSDFVEELKIQKWTHVKIPIKVFLEQNIFAKPLKMRTVFFSQNLPDKKEHTLFIEDLKITSKNILNGDSTFVVVVLGSSTAAGTGAKPIDSSWVNLYKNYLKSINSKFQVINLAVGGYTSYHLMPNKFLSIQNRPLPVLGKNISYGLSFNPSVIIINLPSNDVASGFSIEEQFRNYYKMKSITDSSKTPLLFTTTQPRNFDAKKRELQAIAKNKFYKDFENVIDFWSSIVTSDNKINDIYNSGDGIHLNNKGHKLLFQRVRDSKYLDKLLHPPNIKY